MKRFPDCQVCLGVEGDADLHRFQFWDDERWRVTRALKDVTGAEYVYLYVFGMGRTCTSTSRRIARATRSTTR